MGMGGITAELTPQEKKTSPAGNGSSRSSRRSRIGSEEEGRKGARFFLAKPGTNGGGPVLEREITSENEALVESFKLGLPYYSVQEWRAVSDLTGKNPQLRRELVSTSSK
jgi:hypothetical protein